MAERKRPARPRRQRKADNGKRRLPLKRRRLERTPAPAHQYCDVVMKGGITSGVAYPLAAVELAKVFRFKNIGGTSAGAIAAAYTAAAEYARDSNTGGFDELARLPQWFGKSVRKDGKSNLFALFQPAEKTAPFFNLLAASLRGRRNWVARAFNVAVATVRGFPGYLAVGAAPGLLLSALAIPFGSGVLFWAALAGGILLLVVGLPLGILAGIARIVLREVPKNNYGLCSGYSEDPEKGQALINWVTDTIDRVAGRDPTFDPPLTFGDLWRGDRYGEAGVNLLMMTTNLTQGRPLSVPFEDPGEKGIGQYYFHTEEFRRLFPPRIVDWLIDHANITEATDRHRPLLPLPKARDLPIAVGARLSLAYPVLLSAVPLYTIDWTRDLPRDKQQPERCWFSDGGISSNFPVHLFDQPLPRWPTFAINLRPPHIDLPDQEVWMPRTHRERGIAIWHRFDADGRPKLFGFLGAIKEVAQNWVDNEQARVPGYRDRVVHITLKPSEGGVNLDMPGSIVADLADRGRRAGKMLADRFVSGPKWDVEVNWDSHRWVRFRSTMQVFEEMLLEMRDGYREHIAGHRSYEHLVSRGAGDPPLEFKWRNQSQQRHAIDTMNEIIEIVETWTKPSQTFDRVDPNDPGPPEPRPTLRIVPRV